MKHHLWDHPWRVTVDSPSSALDLTPKTTATLPPETRSGASGVTLSGLVMTQGRGFDAGSLPWSHGPSIESP
jgi:hypothetical protein